MLLYFQIYDNVYFVLFLQHITKQKTNRHGIEMLQQKKKKTLHETIQCKLRLLHFDPRHKIVCAIDLI